MLEGHNPQFPIALTRIMAHFPLYNHFSHMKCLKRFAIYPAIVHLSYIPYFPWDPPCHVHRVDLFTFPSYSNCKDEVPIGKILLDTRYFVVDFSIGITIINVSLRSTVIYVAFPHYMQFVTPNYVHRIKLIHYTSTFRGYFKQVSNKSKKIMNVCDLAQGQMLKCFSKCLK